MVNAATKAGLNRCDKALAFYIIGLIGWRLIIYSDALIFLNRIMSRRCFLSGRLSGLGLS